MIGAGDVEGEASEHGEVLRSVVATVSRGVLGDDHVEFPVERVFESSVKPSEVIDGAA